MNPKVPARCRARLCFGDCGAFLVSVKATTISMVKLRCPSRVGVVSTGTPETVTEQRSLMDFNIQLAQALLDSSEQFPVNFSEAWVWLGYSTKQKALNTLESYFEEKVDYIFKVNDPNSRDKFNQQVEKTTSRRSSHLYFLTANCLKEFGMIARTEQGRLIRKYFLECEKIAKQAIAQQPISTAAELPVIMPTEQELDYMRSRAWEKAEMMGLPVPAEKIKQRTGYRRATDIVRAMAERAQNALASSDQ